MINVLEIRLRRDKLWKGQHSRSFWMPAKRSHQDTFRKYHKPTYVAFPPGTHLWGYLKNWIKLFMKALNNPLLRGCTEFFFQICWGQLGAIYLANIYWTHTLSPAPHSALESTVSSRTCPSVTYRLLAETDQQKDVEFDSHHVPWRKPKVNGGEQRRPYREDGQGRTVRRGYLQ